MAEKNFRKGPHAAKNKVIDVEAVPMADERKTVILDEQLDGVEFDDKVWLYWTRNKKSIITSIVLAFAIVIGVQSWKMYKVSAENAQAKAFTEAATMQQRAEFAKEYAGSSLAGVALLENADALYSEGKFAEAKKAYAEAKSGLSATVLFGRAVIGEAVSAYSLDKSKGLEALKVAYNDVKISGVYKAQAGYLLAIALKDAGKNDDAKKIFEAVANDAKGGYFTQMASQQLMSM